MPSSYTGFLLEDEVRANHIAAIVQELEAKYGKGSVVVIHGDGTGATRGG
jgi:hypothetical protein